MSAPPAAAWDEIERTSIALDPAHVSLHGAACDGTASAIPCLETPYNRVGTDLINRYLAIKQREMI
jgi:hypothetical protein